MANVLSFVAIIAVLGGLWWLTSQYEPHWCAKDGQRFTARVRVLQTDERLRADAARELARPSMSMFGMLGMGMGGAGSSKGALSYRWRDARAFVDDDRLQVVTRVGPVRRPLPPARVVARADQPARGRWVYMLDTSPPRELRVPVKSKAVASLDRLVAVGTGNAPPTG